MRQRLSQLFELESANDSGEGGVDAAGTNSLPSFEDRVSLYLRALHGPREFSVRERASARRELLDEMASQIVKMHGMPGVVQTVEREPLGVSLHAAMVTAQASVRSTTRASDLAERAVSAALMMESANLIESPLGLLDHSQLDRLPLDAARQTAEPRRAPIQRPGRVSIIGAAAFVLALAIPGWLEWSSFRNDEPHSDVAMRLPQSEARALVAPSTSYTAPEPVKPSTRFTQGLGLLPNRQNVQSEVSQGEGLRPADGGGTRADPELVVKLVQLANSLINAGDVSAARMVLKEAADVGSAPAALALGSTFDPYQLERTGNKHIVPDIAMAKLWYARARELGSREAIQRLDTLARPPK